MSYPQRNLKWVTDWYFGDFEDKDVINSGWCYVWAWIAKLNYHDAQLYTFTDVCAHGHSQTHAFLKIGSLYYDSSQPRGCRAAKCLGFFVDQDIKRLHRGNALKHTSREFKDFWGWSGTNKNWSSQGLIAWPDRLPLRVFADDGSLMPSYHLVEQRPVLISSALALESGTAPA